MVWVRILGALGLTLAAGGAQASSFVALGASTSTPSVVTLSAPEPEKAAESTKAGPSTPSIVALGKPVPDVTYEKVAAIPSQAEPKHDFRQSPMIIRGGIVGDAFARPAPLAAPAAVTAAKAPAASTRSDKEATATNGEPATSQPTPIPDSDLAE
ncbi:hypothetical protein EJ066_16240 [Mesorhizobium sp. M9A.F.Ca.ET.002.03.1.2]|uniref:hypothetical protein n=1 Tax=Mesorhizobium sp. M9A.F.Ca.ET.002.03.1.2 TaxID=2493668 RepID=UPI000F74E403|nr:hypothetical protein [Mesorhizobium sp. M9A.F.Ca.ET.002.03.1.2]AZN98594.1 hypothetical protein EJ066_16240 [Mesorhizobium sp. M9A.F.Ca.ET.002.03.1.2]